MAQSASMTTSTSDRQHFINFATAVQEERRLLDDKKRLEDEVKSLDQILSLITLTSSSASNFTVQAVAKVVAEKKMKIARIVR